MAITFSCLHCKKTISIKDHFAGKKGLCPKCRKPVVVPMQSTASAARPTLGDAELEAMAMEAVAQKPADQTNGAVVEHTCPYCDANLRFPADLAGRNAPCPECKRVIKVPQLAATGPRDWRKPETQAGPSGAKLSESELRAKQEWASQAAPANVSRQALLEAKVLPVERERLTVGQWVRGGVVAAVVLFAVIGGVAWYSGFRQDRLEERAFAIAEKAAAGQQAGWPAELQAQYQAYLGLYYHRTGKLDEKGRRGSQIRFQMARQAADRIVDPVERAEVIREVLSGMLETGVDTDEMAALLGQTPPEAREAVIAELSRRLVSGTAAAPELLDERVRIIRQVIERAVPAQIRQAPPANDARNKEAPPAASPAARELDYSDQLACLGRAGIEMVTAGHTQKARELADSTAFLVKDAKNMPIPILTLWLLTNKSIPDAPIDDETRQSAQVAALARSKNLAKAKTILDQGLKTTVALRLATVLDLADTLQRQGEKAEALTWARHGVSLLEPLRLEETVRERQKLLELIAANADAGLADPLAGKLLPANWLAAQRARVTVFRETVLPSTGPIDEQKAQAVANAAGPAAAVAFLTGEHNARLNPGDALHWAETGPPDSLRAFAALGVALGIAERRK
jgi:hypothetical protein